MEIERDTKMFPADDNLPAEVAKMVAEGWQIEPGQAPMAVYHVVRIKDSSDGMGCIGKMTIDDSGVFIIPAKGN